MEEKMPLLKQPFRFLKQPKKKAVFFAIIGIILVIAIVVSISIYNRNYFSRLVTQMLGEYPFADNAVGKGGRYLKIDTNPYDKEPEDLSVGLAATFYQKQRDSLNGIEFVNEKLGFPASVYEKMLNTSSIMGMQTAETNKFRVSWTYHPTRGIEVMYEKK